MFFQIILDFFIIILFLILAWKLIAEPILKIKGIEVDDVKTGYTKKLEQLKKEYNEKYVSAEAAEEGVKLAKEIKELENKIAEADKSIKENKK